MNGEPEYSNNQVFDSQPELLTKKKKK